MGDMIEIRVSDNGIGISQADQARVFERFYRVNTDRSRASGGTGLGLSIVKHVAVNHGGDVGIWSAEGSGSTFTLRLPAAQHPHAVPNRIEDPSALMDPIPADPEPVPPLRKVVP